MQQHSPNSAIALFVKDFLGGMTDAGLLEKYQLTAAQLRAVFRALLDRGTITAVDFESWQIFHNIAVPLSVRLYPRTTLAVPQPVYEAANPNNRGSIVNISEYGMGLRGIHGHPENVMNFVIPSNSLSMQQSTTIQARCKWTATLENNDGPASGYYVVVVNETSWERVRRALAVRTIPDPSTPL